MQCPHLVQPIVPKKDTCPEKGFLSFPFSFYFPEKKLRTNLRMTTKYQNENLINKPGTPSNQDITSSKIQPSNLNTTGSSSQLMGQLPSTEKLIINNTATPSSDQNQEKPSVQPAELPPTFSSESYNTMEPPNKKFKCLYCSEPFNFV